jgi:hypothetical protein
MSTHLWLLVVFVYIFKNSHFSLNSMFWPFPGLLVPTMTSASNNQCRQLRFRFIYHNLMPCIYGQRFFSWTTDNSRPQELEVRGSNQDIYGQPMVSLWSARRHTYPCLIHRYVERPRSGMVPSAFLCFRSPRTMAGGWAGPKSHRFRHLFKLLGL